jgi:hypothetical protein
MQHAHMDMHGVLIAAVGGGIGGALGALIGFGIGRVLPHKWRRGVETLCAVALAVVGARLAPMVAGPAQTQNPASIEAQVLADPVAGEMAGAWKQSDPVSFQAFIARLNAAMQSGGAAAAIELVRADLIAAARPRLGALSDAELVELIRVSRDQMRELRTAHPIVCHPLFHGRAFGDVTPYLSEGLRQRELALLTAAFRADLAAPRATLSGDALNAAIDRVVAATRASFGEDIALIAPDASIEDREPRVCEAAAALYDQMQKLPEAEAAGLMRGLVELSNAP